MPRLTSPRELSPHLASQQELLLLLLLVLGRLPTALLLAPPQPPPQSPSPVHRIAGGWRSQPLHVPTRRADGSDAVDAPLLGNGGIGAVLGGPASNITWFLGANEFFGGPSCSSGV